MEDDDGRLRITILAHLDLVIARRQRGARSFAPIPLCLPFLSTSNHEIVMHEAAQIAILQQQQAQAQQWHHNQQWYTTLMEWHPAPH